MLQVFPYDRQTAVAYAHRWAFSRNPAYFDFSGIGGDCTNYASQCVYAGAHIMNYTPTFGWYYINANDRTASWTGVEYFYNYMTSFMQDENEPGPFMEEVSLDRLEPGDVVQLRFDEGFFAHTPVVVQVGTPPTPENILVAAHSNDADNRPLSTYTYNEVRALHVVGVRVPVCQLKPPAVNTAPAVPTPVPTEQKESGEQAAPPVT